MGGRLLIKVSVSDQNNLPSSVIKESDVNGYRFSVYQLSLGSKSSNIYLSHRKVPVQYKKGFPYATTFTLNIKIVKYNQTLT